MIEQLGPDDVEWMTVCYAMSDKNVSDTLLRRSIELGGHVRVGVGDLPVASNGRTNAELVAEIVEAGQGAGRRPATAQEVLEMARKLG
jgi:uncharacterized protein (DUF849 family)